MKLIIIFSMFFMVFVNSAGIANSAENPFPPYYFSANISEFPSVLDGETVKNYINFDYLSENTKYIDNIGYTQAIRKSLAENMDVQNVPASIYVKFAFTKSSVNMRMIPSHAVLHSGDQKFDMNQYTRIGMSSPVAVLHISADQRFYYVQTEFMRGWVQADSLFFYDEEIFRSMLKLPFIRIKRDKTNIGGLIYSIGDRIPVKKTSPCGYIVILPDGVEKFVFKSYKISMNNEKFSTTKIKNMAKSQLHNPYDWGGKEGFRDCSSFVRDLWLVFGVELPRNTSLQSQVGREIIGKPQSEEEFYNALKTAKPFKTLIFFKGHVLLYGGMKRNDFIVYHSVNGLNDDNGVRQPIAAVVRQELMKDSFSQIWTRVIKVTEIDSTN